jgi:urease accessory protein
MLAGGLLGFNGLQMPLMENAIAASVLAFGLLVAVAIRLPMIVTIALTALFALTHGVAHGLELPVMTSPWGYAAGFVGTTAALHISGYALVRLLPRAAAPGVRLLGVASAFIGAWLLAG